MHDIVFIPLMKVVRNTVGNRRVNVDLNNINTTAAIKFVMKSATSFSHKPFVRAPHDFNSPFTHTFTRGYILLTCGLVFKKVENTRFVRIVLIQGLTSLTFYS